MKYIYRVLFAIVASFGISGAALAANNGLVASGSLYSGLVTNVLNGEIGTVTAIALVALGIFFAFRSMAMTVLALAAAIVFWNAESILNGMLGMVI